MVTAPQAVTKVYASLHRQDEALLRKRAQRTPSVRSDTLPTRLAIIFKQAAVKMTELGQQVATEATVLRLPALNFWGEQASPPITDSSMVVLRMMLR